MNSRSRAPRCARSNSSSLRCSALVSRFWVFWIRNTIRKVTIVVPVLITNCQVSENPNTGPVTAHTMSTSAARQKAQELPAQSASRPAILANHACMHAPPVCHSQAHALYHGQYAAGEGFTTSAGREGGELPTGHAGLVPPQRAAQR